MATFLLTTRPGLLKAENNLSPSLGLVAVNLHFATKVFTAVPKFLGHCMWVPAAYKQTKMKSIRPLTLQLGHVIERCIKIDRWSSMVKI